eukprot:Hpha_TRINITY_DN16179_c3_g11::TRINITY_DN16179_c3_g11_i1::g.7997::m.7997
MSNDSTRYVADKTPDRCHLPPASRCPLRASPAVTVPAGLLGGVFLWEDHHDIVGLPPGTEPGMRNEGVIKTVPGPSLRPRVESRAAAVEENVHAAGRRARVKFTACRNVHVPGAPEGHGPTRISIHPKWLLVKGDDAGEVDRACVLRGGETLPIDELERLPGAVEVTCLQSVHRVGGVCVGSLFLRATWRPRGEGRNCVERGDVVYEAGFPTERGEPLRRLLHDSMCVARVFRTPVHPRPGRRQITDTVYKPRSRTFPRVLLQSVHINEVWVEQQLLVRGGGAPFAMVPQKPLSGGGGRLRGKVGLATGGTYGSVVLRVCFIAWEGPVEGETGNSTMVRLARKDPHTANVLGKCRRKLHGEIGTR